MVTIGHTLLASTQATTNYKKLYSSYQVVQDQSQKTDDISLQKNPSESSQNQQTQCQLQIITEHYLISSTSGIPKVWPRQATEPTGLNLTLWDEAPTQHFVHYGCG